MPAVRGSDHVPARHRHRDGAAARGPRLPARAPRGLRHRLPRVPLAGARASSTGRSTGSTCSLPRAASGRRCGSSSDDGRETQTLVRRAVALAPTRWPTGCASRASRAATAMIVMLGNQVELWETILAAMKLGAVIIPATPLLGPADLVDRVERGDARHVVVSARRRRASSTTCPATTRGIAVGEPVAGWMRYADADGAAAAFAPDGPTAASDTLLLYFTSGTTAKPKLVEHTHASYPVGHLSTMYWIGLQPGDVHLNISSPGWAKHAWSNVYRAVDRRGDGAACSTSRASTRGRLLDQMVRCGGEHVLRAADRVADADPGGPRSLAGAAARGAAAGEPLNPEVIEQVRRALGHHRPRRLRADRDHGADRQHARPAGQARLDGPPAAGLRRRAARSAQRRAGRGGGDRARPRAAAARTDDRLPRRPSADAAATRPAATTARATSRRATPTATSPTSGAADDVFKASDYRISPFELESVLIEHEAVAEAAVVPSPDPMRLAVPKAVRDAAPGHEPTRETRARRSCASRASTSRRTSASAGWSSPSCRRRSRARSAASSCATRSTRASPAARFPARAALEFWEEDFPELKR